MAGAPHREPSRRRGPWPFPPCARGFSAALRPLGPLRRTRCGSWRLVARIPTRKTAMAGICGRSKARAHRLLCYCRWPSSLGRRGIRGFGWNGSAAGKTSIRPGLARPSFSICVAGVALPLVRCNCPRAPRIVPSIRALSDHSMLRVRRRGAPYGLPPRKWERSEALSALWFVGLAVVPRAACPTCASRLFPQFMFAPVGRFRQIPPQPPRSTSGPPKDERRTLRSTFGAPKDERRTPRSTFGAPQERESRLHRFRPESPQQTLGSQGAPPTERRTGRSHCLLAVAVVALAEGPRARPSHLAFNIIISTSISSAGCGKYHLRSTPSVAVRIKSTQYHVSCF